MGVNLLLTLLNHALFFFCRYIPLFLLASIPTEQVQKEIDLFWIMFWWERSRLTE